jgi:DNA-binding MarR family transcriptional regulator
MTDDPLDPLIHVPARLRIVATLATLPDGDTLTFTRLQDMIGLTPGNLITHLRKLEAAGCLSSEKTSNGTASRTTVALTHRSRGPRLLHRGAARPARRPVDRSVRAVCGSLSSSRRRGR